MRKLSTSVKMPIGQLWRCQFCEDCRLGKLEFHQLARETFTLASGHRAVRIVEHSSTYCVQNQTLN